MEAELRRLDAAAGSGTSVVTLLIPAGGNLTKSIKMLESELATARQIKDRLNRASVQHALTAAIEKVRGVPALPANGLAVFAGEVAFDGGKPRKTVILIEPPQRIVRGTYRCGSKFLTDDLHEMVAAEDAPRYGYVVIDGQGLLVAAS